MHSTAFLNAIPWQIVVRGQAIHERAGMTRMKQLFRFEPASGMLMVAAICLALVAVNSPLKDVYRLVHHMPVHVRIGAFVVDRPLIAWINEGLMTFFFLLVGLEIKRQLLEGHLSSLKCAALPVFAALGGMGAPAAIYAALNWGNPAHSAGWAIPTATDIVLALGVLSLLGEQVPVTLRVFLTALAIFDDIGAVAIVALFYGESVASGWLALAGTAGLFLVLLNRLGARWAWLYALSGVFLWAAMLKAGIDAALAGALIGFAVPMRVQRPRSYSPLRKAERILHPWCGLFIVPVFAFFNAGIVLSVDSLGAAFGTVSLGIVAGLFVGKQAGVMAGAWLAVWAGLAAVPEELDWQRIYGAALFAGIGFTMSLYIATLALPDPSTVNSAKTAILVGSILSAGFGLAYLANLLRSSRVGVSTIRGGMAQ